jgi:hypothetical protein
VTTASAISTALVVMLGIALAAPGAAQEAEAATGPNLTGPWRIDWPAGNVEVLVTPRLILEAFDPQDGPVGLVGESDSFVSGRASLFIDTFLGDHILASLELRGDRGEAPSSGDLTGRVEQAFLRVTPWSEPWVSLQYGRFVSPFGA